MTNSMVTRKTLRRPSKGEGIIQPAKTKLGRTIDAKVDKLMDKASTKLSGVVAKGKRSLSRKK